MTTLSDLITLIRQRTNLETSQFVTDAEITSYLNSSLDRLDRMLIGTSEDYKLSSSDQTITTATDGSNYFTLPADFSVSRLVQRQVSGGAFENVPRFQMRERSRYDYPMVRSVVEVCVAYAIEGNRCTIVPAQQSAGTYRLWYAPKFILLVAPSDTLEPYMDQPSWIEYAVVDVGVKILQKQDLDASQWIGSAQDLRQHLIESTKPRDQGAPKKIILTRESGDRDRWR